MKPRPRSYDPFATLHTLVPVPAMPAANEPTHRATMSMPVDDRSALERRYPGIVSAVTVQWGHPEMNDYFDRLWLADSTSTPIDPEAMSDLMVLAQVHQWLAPRRQQHSLATIYGTDQAAVKSRGDPWAITDHARRR